MKMWLEGVYVGAAYEAAGIVAAWQCPEYLKQRFRNTSMEYPGVRFDVEANDNALLATTSMTKEILRLYQYHQECHQPHRLRLCILF